MEGGQVFNSNSSGTPNQQTKHQKKKKTERRQETSGPKSLPSNNNTSAEGGTSKKQDEKNQKITILSASDGRTWTLNLAYLTRQSNDIRKMVRRQTNLRGLVRHGKSNTFELRGIEARHFGLFLAALRASRDFNFPLDDLKTILTLARDWGFPRIQNRSMNALQNLRLPPVDKLILARRCQIPEWIHEAYLTLAVRTPGLETVDASALGSTGTSAITRAKEIMVLHRMHALTLVDSDTQDRQCQSPSQACREALCEIRLALLAKKTKVPKRKDAQARIFLREVSKLGLELCETCRPDAAIARTIVALDEEISIAERVFGDDIGWENSDWLRNA